MAKKKPRKHNSLLAWPKNSVLIQNLTLTSIFSIILVGIIIFKPSINLVRFQIKTPRTQAVLGISQIATPAVGEASKSATVSAIDVTPKPSPKINFVPINNGRQIHVPILYYHYIGNNPNPADTERDALSITPDRFAEQMKYLAQNGYHTMTYPEVYDALKGGSLPTKPIMLSFDDGYEDLFFNAFPILQQNNLKSVAFIPTGLVDSGFYLKWDQIKQMNATGLVDFEAHSVTHANLQALTLSQLKEQLIQSKQKLESELGRPVNFMAYPYGASDALVWQETKNAGYLSAVGTWYSAFETEGQIFDLPRIRMGGAVSLEEFIRKIQ